MKYFYMDIPLCTFEDVIACLLCPISGHYYVLTSVISIYVDFNSKMTLDVVCLKV